MSYLNKQTIILAMVCLFSAPFALAQSSFDQGSFGSDGGGSVSQQPVVTPTPSAPPPNSFGGSFEEGGSFQPGSFAPDATPTPDNSGQVPIPGGADFTGDSFEETQPGVTPTPPQQVVVNPPSPAPQPQPQPQPQPTPSGPTIDPQVTALETRDFGIPPTQQLRNGQFHSPTPTSIPGGQLVTTQHLANAMNGNVAMVVVDVLGGQYALPNAYAAQAMAQGGNFNDYVQQQTAQWLGQVTQGQREIPIVIYCSDPMCWLSYNASLRAIAAGYTNVYWYRGGINAWQQAGLPLRPGSY